MGCIYRTNNIVILSIYHNNVSVFVLRSALLLLSWQSFVICSTYMCLLSLRSLFELYVFILFFVLYCRLKAYIVFTFLDSFRNNSGKPQPIPTKVGTHAQVNGRQRSRNFRRDRLSGRNGGLKNVPDAGVFCQQYEFTFRQFRNGRFSPNLAMIRESWLKRRFWKEI